MRHFTSLLLCLFALNLNAQQEDIKQLLSMQIVDPSMVTDICDPAIANNNLSPTDSIAYQLNPSQTETNEWNPTADQAGRKKAQLRVEAHSVSVMIINGYTYHIAGYFDGTRVVTCLDGNLKGYQAISLNGVLQAESTVVEWHKKYFVHYYLAGKVTSHLNKQVCEIY